VVVVAATVVTGATVVVVAIVVDGEVPSIPGAEAQAARRIMNGSNRRIRAFSPLHIAAPPTVVDMAIWDPAQYLRFSSLRMRPALDLIGRIALDDPARIWDLGCGHGAPTRVLADRWPDARITGLDSSAAMLEQAADDDRIEWVEGDIGAWRPEEPVDLIFSNAALHWLDDHGTLFPRLVSHLAPGGVLAVQMPRNHGEPSHQRLYETARSDRWADQVGHLVRDFPVSRPDAYHHLLRPTVSSLDVWETVYQQQLSGNDAVANWATGSVVRPFLDALGDDGGAFLEDYATRLARHYPAGPDGVTLFAFRRLFLVATN
jgi:trans-aconitate 2-methyltransferase